MPSEDRQKGRSKKVVFCLGDSIEKSNYKVTPLGKYMETKRIHTRRFPDPNPPKVVENPERILRRSSTPTNKGISHLQRASSLPTESVKCFTSFDFDKETD